MDYPEERKQYIDGIACQLSLIHIYDFAGILKAAALYLLLLLTGFVLNALDTWILQKMGQQIIYQMREEVFTLSLIHI